MAGGVTHLDSFDPKPDAPAAVRGTLRPIPTAIPGVRFTEVLPNLARSANLTGREGRPVPVLNEGRPIPGVLGSG